MPCQVRWGLSVHRCNWGTAGCELVGVGCPKATKTCGEQERRENCGQSPDCASPTPPIALSCSTGSQSFGAGRRLLHKHPEAIHRSRSLR